MITIIKKKNFNDIKKIIINKINDLIIFILRKIKSEKEEKKSKKNLLKEVKHYIQEEGKGQEYNDNIIRHEEFQVFKNDNNTKELKSNKQKILGTEHDIFNGLIESVVVVEKL